MRGAPGPDEVGQPPLVEPTAETTAEPIVETEGDEAEDEPGSQDPPSGGPSQDPPSGGPSKEDSRADLDEFIARAVDRQIAEQRALRDTIGELRDAIKTLDAKPSGLDTDELTEQLRRLTRVNTDAVLAEMREMRDNLLAAPERERDTRLVTEELGGLQEAVGTASADIEGIAQALIDLNAGLRAWADDVDRSIGSIGENVDNIREQTATTRELQTQTLDEVRAIVEDDEPVDHTDPELVRSITTFQSDIQQRMKESVELSLYLADQIENFDQVLTKFGDVPERLEGIVSQALKRTLAARAKLDTDAQAWLNDALTALDDHVARIEETTADLGKTADALRTLKSGQSELASRVDSLQKGVMRRLDEIEAHVSKAPKRKPKAAGKRASSRKATERRTRKATSAPGTSETVPDDSVAG